MVESGRDFYAAPCAGPDGRLAFLAWDHPLLPFIGCELWAEGARVAGGPDESIFQPEWGPDGALYWVSDRDGWWNLYRDGEQLTKLEAELATAAVLFGLRTYAFLADGRIACTLIEMGVHSFAVLDPAYRRDRALDLPFTASTPYVGRMERGSPFSRRRRPRRRHPTSSMRTAATTRRSPSWHAELDPASISVGRAIEFESHGRTAHAFYYPPANADFEGPKARGRLCASSSMAARPRRRASASRPASSSSLRGVGESST